MAIQFTSWGAARQVTGSMHLLELQDGFRILVDCGLEMGTRSQDPPFGFEPSSINLVILTHAHMDHCGRLPELVREGYSGEILCTEPTMELSALLLRDSAQLQAKRLAGDHHGRAKGRKKGEQAFKKLAHRLGQDAEHCLRRFHPLRPNKSYRIRENLRLKMIPCSHLLGAVSVYLEVEDQGRWIRFGWSGDLGRSGYPGLPDPEPFPEVDYLVCESTYGGVLHQETRPATEVVLAMIRDALSQEAGKLLVPAFSVGRTQAFLLVLQQLFENGLLPDDVPVFVDSPMAIQSTEVYRQMEDWLSREAQNMIKMYGDVFSFERLRFVQSIGQSRKIASDYKPSILVSASGMLDGGRIHTHLKEQLQNSKACVLFIGYLAEGSLGRQLADGASHVTVDGRSVMVRAKLCYTDIFSGHADHRGLMNFATRTSSQVLKQIFLVHGEIDRMEALASDLVAQGYRVELPQRGQTYVLA
ncbi:MAG: MBL fold metallo-hydrolase RNA specificity domain-containing protein [Bacteroidia bacterium]